MRQRRQKTIEKIEAIKISQALDWKAWLTESNRANGVNNRWNRASVKPVIFISFLKPVKRLMGDISKHPGNGVLRADRTAETSNG